MPPNLLKISIDDARRFMLDYHGLFPPKKRKGEQGLLDFIKEVGCIQFDPINIVGRNPDLVLQSRIRDYRPAMLDKLLYHNRSLVDGWDKMASIYSMEDWSYFLKRKRFIKENPSPRRPKEEILKYVQEEIRDRGPLSSLELEGMDKIDWAWGPTKASRAALEQLYIEGILGVHHRINNRRYFDLIERLVPEQFLAQSDPFITEQEYHQWHIIRRVGSMGLISTKSGDYWLGIQRLKSSKRNEIIRELIESGSLVKIIISEIPDQTYLIRSKDLYILDRKQNNTNPPEVSFIAALDNLTWNRNLIKNIFNFEYVWEVYKPKNQRKYGYYVLPVLFGDRFVARFEPQFNKKSRKLTLLNWWWEQDYQPDQKIQHPLSSCLHDFMTYLEANHLELGETLRYAQDFSWLKF